MANALNVTFLGYSGAGDPLDLITGFNGVLVFDVISPAEVANSFIFCDRPTPCCFWIRGDAIDWVVVAGDMYLEMEKILCEKSLVKRHGVYLNSTIDNNIEGKYFFWSCLFIEVYLIKKYIKTMVWFSLTDWK